MLQGRSLGGAKPKILGGQGGSAALQVRNVHVIDFMKHFSLHGRANSG
jgi:hypothetical protein